MATVAASVSIAASSSLDNLSVGVGYSLKSVRIGWSRNLLVAVINSTGMLVTMWGGSELRPYLPPVLGSFLAGCVFIALGLWELLRLCNVYRMRRAAPGGGGAVELKRAAQEIKEDDDEARGRALSEDLAALAVVDVPDAAPPPPPRPPPPPPRADSWLAGSCLLPGDCVVPDRASRPGGGGPFGETEDHWDLVARARGGDDAAAPAARPAAADSPPGTPFHGWFTRKSLGSEVNLNALCDGAPPPPPPRRELARPGHRPTIPRPRADDDDDVDVEDPEPCAAAAAFGRRPPLMRRISYVGLGKTPPLVRNFLLISSACRRCRRTRPPAADAEEQGDVHHMGASEAFVLGLALTLSNIAAGIAAGMARLPIPLTVAATLACSFVFMLAGQRAGGAVRDNARRHCSFGHDEISAASALIFIVVGVLFLPVVGA